MFTEQRVVDDRVFMLGLDKLYRDAMMRHERGELLMCARQVAETLGATPADVPIEGYYAEDEQLSEYFRLIRALRKFGSAAESSVDMLPGFHRLREVMSAPLYGHPQDDRKLLPTGRDALSRALDDTFPDWTVEGLTQAACIAARETDEISLVGLAALTRDPVVLAAIRESVVLYAEVIVASGRHQPAQYIWKVNEVLAKQAKKFIDTFNTLFDNELPPPEQSHAGLFWHAFEDNEIVGRCVCIGADTTALPTRYYHWAIGRTPRGHWAVRDFWNPEIRTSSQNRPRGRARRRKPGH